MTITLHMDSIHPSQSLYDLGVRLWFRLSKQNLKSTRIGLKWRVCLKD